MFHDHPLRAAFAAELPQGPPIQNAGANIGPAVFVKHQLVTPENVDHIYPNDHLMQVTV